MPLTYEQTEAELKADDWALSRIVKAEADAGDETAKQLIRCMNARRADPPDLGAEPVAIELYTGWRKQHEAEVGPIAFALKHEAPNGKPAEPEIVHFAGTSFIPEPAPPLEPPVSQPAKRSRRSWKAQDIVELTKAFATWENPRALDEAVKSLGRDAGEVRRKALELGLIASPQKRELNDDEKKQVEAVIAAIPADPLFVQYAIKALKAQS